MIPLLRLFAAAVVLLVVAAPAVHAGNTGKITGKVTDAQSGDAIPFVNILVVGTQRGASTDAQLLEVVMSLKQGKRSIPVAEITRIFVERFGGDYELPITNRYIGSLLRKRLRLKTYKTEGVYVVAMGDEGKLATLCLRYRVTVAIRL